MRFLKFLIENNNEGDNRYDNDAIRTHGSLEKYKTHVEKEYADYDDAKFRRYFKRNSRGDKHRSSKSGDIAHEALYAEARKRGLLQ